MRAFEVFIYGGKSNEKGKEYVSFLVYGENGKSVEEKAKEHMRRLAIMFEELGYEREDFPWFINLRKEDIALTVAVTEYIIRKPEDLNFLIRHYNKYSCLLYTSPSPRDRQKPRMPSSA